MTVKFKLAFSIFLIWLFNISGIFGILSEESEWFLAMTPLNLFLYLVFITWNLKDFKRFYVYVFVILFLIGFVTEFLGVNYGYIFGNYAYGSNLGYKIGGVPVMICVNWVILTITTADVSSYIHKNIWIRSLVGAFLMTLLDVVIEVSAPRFDFWEFEGGSVPIQNYTGWYAVSLFAHYVYQKNKVNTDQRVSIQILIAVSIFFTAFLFF